MLDKEQKIIQDFKETFGTDHGKRVLERLESLSTLNRSSVGSDRGKPIDVNRLIYDEGQRAIMLYIERQLNKEIKETRSSKNARGS